MKELPTTSQFIKKYGLDAKKSLGQNFILDKNTVSYPNAAPIWMDSFEILIDTVSNEQQTHLAIYH